MVHTTCTAMHTKHTILKSGAQVKSARDETWTKYKADPLHVRRKPEFSLDVLIPNWKVGMDASHNRLWSEVCPGRIYGDVRVLKSHYTFDKQRNHAFARVRVCLICACELPVSHSQCCAVQ